jgi:hypothetical protein
MTAESAVTAPAVAAVINPVTSTRDRLESALERRDRCDRHAPHACGPVQWLAVEAVTAVIAVTSHAVTVWRFRILLLVMMIKLQDLTNKKSLQL